MKCSCGQELREKYEMNLRLREEVRVLYCMCGRTREIIEKGDLRFIYSAHDKFKMLADKL